MVLAGLWSRRTVLYPTCLPVALAGAGGGALLGHYASKDQIPGESPRDRRHGILWMPPIGLTLGGTAGAAIPAGVNALTQSVQPMSSFHPVDAAAYSAMRHWAPTASGIGGTLFGLHVLGLTVSRRPDSLPMSCTVFLDRDAAFDCVPGKQVWHDFV
jgi:hypothetical protein